MTDQQINPSVKGWCPGALRPMASGDGLVVRVRAHGSRLTVAQAVGVADLAQRFGSGLIDLGTRGHVQLRGVRETTVRAVQNGLHDLGLLDANPAFEARRNILTTPIWQGDDTLDLVRALETALAYIPDLTPKFGFAVDTGEQAILGTASADIRIERAAHGVILRADGLDLGEYVARDAIIWRVRDLACWFARIRGPHTRMAQVVAAYRVGDLPAVPVLAQSPPLTTPALRPGPTPWGMCLGLPFGQVTAQVFRALAIAPLRLTPWRSVIVEGVQDMPVPAGLIAAPNDPLLRVVACTGAPGCRSATVPTRALARALAPQLRADEVLHVSGCAKGCAHPGPATITLTGRDGRYDVILNGPAAGNPTAHARTPDSLMDLSPFQMALTREAPMRHSYETNGAAIYDASFATIRAEADLARFTQDEEPVAVRMIHASGMVALAPHIHFAPGFAVQARRALMAGAPILCDARMVSEGITRARLPADNQVICTLQSPDVPALAARLGTTRSAAAVELWRPYLAGAVVAIGNAPTALFHLLNRMAEAPDFPRPAAIIGCPVGFIGAAESKAALVADDPVPWCVVEGRLGGSAMTVAAVNALASRKE